MNSLIVANILFAQETEPVGVPGWIPVAIGVILLLLFWWGLSRNSIPQEPEIVADDGGDEEEVEETAVSGKISTIPVTEEAAKPDNLKKIEGEDIEYSKKDMPMD